MNCTDDESKLIGFRKEERTRVLSFSIGTPKRTTGVNLMKQRITRDFPCFMRHCLLVIRLGFVVARDQT